MAPDAEELSFGNSVYKITFENRERPTYGHKYWFFLQDAVENVPEYVVRWDNFVQYVHPSLHAFRSSLDVRSSPGVVFAPSPLTLISLHNTCTSLRRCHNRRASL